MVLLNIQPTAIHYLPIATTLMASGFAFALANRLRLAPDARHHQWWLAGVACYGIGTALESTVTLVGNSPWLNKTWYCFGALLGAYPLAQGTLWLLASKATARRITVVTAIIVAVLCALTLFGPIDPDRLQSHRPSGDALDWQWLRRCTPLVNGYAALVLVGGAAWSAVRFARMNRPGAKARAIGTALIAVGGILPGIGGAMAKTGRVEALYIAEFVGLALIWSGHTACSRA